MKKAICFFLFILLFNCKFLHAQSVDTTNIVRRNSISLGTFIVFGNIQLNYERLIGERHGVVLEGFWDSDAPGLNTLTFGIAYRFHIKKSMDGFFISTFFRTGSVQQSIKISENQIENEYTMKTNLNLIGLGIGNRWMFKNGISIVLRAGYGYQIAAKYDWLPQKPNDENAMRFNELLQGSDLELGIGYTF